MFFSPKLPSEVNPFRFANSINYTNAAADWAFYDVNALNSHEFNYLVNEVTVEGAVLIALPSGQRDMGVLKYKDFTELKAGKGKPVQRFSIAGVGSSDIGAAAFARTLANYYQEPVGAIVAGYGVADLLQEALGGWFVLGGVNRAMSFWENMFQIPLGQQLENGHSERHHQQEHKKALGSIAELSPDTNTLLSLLKEEKREILSIAGHSKGSLSITLALDVLTREGDAVALEKAKKVEMLTFGAVSTFSEEFQNVRQFIGGLDWFGGLNSRPLEDRISVPNAWHHLNTSIPYHLDLVKVLQENQQ